MLSVILKGRAQVEMIFGVAMESQLDLKFNIIIVGIIHQDNNI